MHIIIDCVYYAADIQVVKGKYCVSIAIFRFPSPILIELIWNYDPKKKALKLL